MSAPVVGGPAKRAFDLVVGSVTLAITSPLFLLVAFAVKATSRGPVFYRAERTGVGREVFGLWKFRSMRAARPGEGPSITEAADSRITLVGKLLRTTKLDELPQLLNVLRGEMSLVGPRPEEADVLERRYPRAIATEILTARPGMTGLLQVRVFPDMTNEIIPEGVDPQIFYFRDQLPRRVAVDLHYVRRWSLAFDLAIILRTVWCILFRAPQILIFGRRPILHALPPVDDPDLLALFSALDPDEEES